MPAAGRSLHPCARSRPFGVEDGQARADFVGKAEQVEFGAELAVVALGGLLEPERQAFRSSLVGQEVP